MMDEKKELTQEVAMETAVQEVQEEPYKSGAVRYIDSREVAEIVGKEHHKLLRDIKNYIEQLIESNIGFYNFFVESSYTASNGKKNKCYLVTKKGCEFIAHKLTGIKGTKFTATYINRFHEMEAELAVPGLAGNSAEKLLEVIKAQNDLIQKHVELMGNMDERIAKAKHARGAESDNPFGSGTDFCADRCRTIDQMATRIAELRRMDKMRVLHLLYREIDARYSISLDAYKSVLQSETGQRHNMLETIAYHDWIYDVAVELCRDSIERHEVFAGEMHDE